VSPRNVLAGAHDPTKARKSGANPDIMASAIGNAAAKVTTIVKVNAVSKFTSGAHCLPTCCLLHHAEAQKSRHRDDAVTASRSRTLCPEGQSNGVPEMVNKALMATRGRL